MSTKVLLGNVLTCDAGLLFLALGLLLRRRAYRDLPFFVALVGVSALHHTLNVGLMYHRKALGISLHDAYTVFCYSGWIAQIVASGLIVLAISNVFRTLMRPLRGLHRVGRLVFGWVAGVSVCLACLVAFGPHTTGTTFFATLCGQVQEGVSILTLCLLLAISFATRPLGLTFRSRVFGVTLGLGLVAMTDLVEAAWLATSGAQSIYSPIHLVSGFGSLAAVAVWAGYFLVREPARKMITLPTTSPFFFWNRIAEALGDAPGEVAVAGITPDMFAPAELLAFRSVPSQSASIIEMPQIPQVAQR